MRRLIPGVATAMLLAAAGVAMSMLLAACTETPSSFPPCVVSPCVEDAASDSLADGADEGDRANDGGTDDGDSMADGPGAVGLTYRATLAPVSRRVSPPRVRGAIRRL